MKNPLQVEISNLIKKANFFFSKSQLQDSLVFYQKALVVFHENIGYNNVVSQHFGSLIQSLKGQVYMKLGQFSSAQSAFNNSLRSKPYDFFTLVRRGKLYCLTNRLAEAIEDAQNAYIHDPQGSSVKQLLNCLSIQIQKIEEEQQKKRLKENFNSIQSLNQSLIEETDNQQLSLSFSNLKQIDRQSFSSRNRNERKFSGFQSQNYTDGNNVDNDYVVIVHKPSRKLENRNLRKCLSINLCQQNLAQNASHQHSIKSIEKKIEKRSSVRFLQNTNTLDLQQNKSHGLKNNKSQRKSCLRNSKLNVQNCKQDGFLNIFGTSSFNLLKNIDGAYISPNNSQLQSQQNTQKNQVDSVNKQFSDSGDENQNQQKQYNIYGHKYRTSKILKCLENIQAWSGKNLQQPDGKKRSILKKDSIISSQRDSRKQKTLEHKNSVHFINQNLKLNRN